MQICLQDLVTLFESRHVFQILNMLYNAQLSSIWWYRGRWGPQLNKAGPPKLPLSVGCQLPRFDSDLFVKVPVSNPSYFYSCYRLAEYSRMLSGCLERAHKLELCLDWVVTHLRCASIETQSDTELVSNCDQINRFIVNDDADFDLWSISC